MKLSTLIGYISSLLALVACMAPSPIESSTPVSEKLILYNWPEYMPQATLEGFQAEHQVLVDYHTYQSLAEADAFIQKNGEFDIAVIAHDMIPNLADAGKLEKLDMGVLTNFINVSPNFRELSYDPGNQYSVPLHWGTVGLLVRTHLVKQPLTRWADLWSLTSEEKIVVRPQQRELMAVALKSLGYSINTEDPVELATAAQHLVELKGAMIFSDPTSSNAVDKFLNSGAVAMIGWAGDALAAQAMDPSVEYILPIEGTLLWGDNLVVSSKSGNKTKAMLFLNYLLRPEVAAEMVNHLHYATANEVALELVKPEYLNNPTIFPEPANFQRAEWWMPLSVEGAKTWEMDWQRFVQAEPVGP